MEADVSAVSGLSLNKVIAEIRTPSTSSQAFSSVEDRILVT
jgi:hypothetical protein